MIFITGDDIINLNTWAKLIDQEKVINRTPDFLHRKNKVTQLSVSQRSASAQYNIYHDLPVPTLANILLNPHAF